MSYSENKENSKIGFVFPGQGSQHIGMGKEVVENFAEARLAFEEASDTLGINMNKLIFGDDEKSLNLTENTQPAILSVSIAILNVINKEFGLEPACVSGHSLGEYSANVFANSVNFQKALLITRKRGIFMQEACPVGFGKMAAVIGLGREEIKEVISVNFPDSDPMVFIANYNSPIQAVISGEAKAVDLVCNGLKERGAKRIVFLPVSAPFHTPFMERAKENLAGFIEEDWLKDADYPVFSNATSSDYKTREDVLKLLLDQIVSPVMWEDVIFNMEKSFGVDTFVEIGPSNVLSSLIKRIDRNARTISVNSITGLKELEDLITEK